MNQLSTAITALTISLCAASPGFAQNATAAPGQSQASPNAATASQKVYDSSGAVIGTISGSITNSYGQRLTAVTVDRRMGIGGSAVLFPAGLLQPRDGGGFTTSLSSEQIKELPRADKTYSK